MKLHPLVSSIAIVAVAFLYLPLAVIAVFSFNASRYTMGWGGFTLRWYQELFRNDVVFEYTVNTLILAAVSTAISTVLGTALAIGMERTPWSRRSTLGMEATVQLPVITPDIIFAAAMVVAFGTLRRALAMVSFPEWIAAWFDPGMPVMVLAHVTFQVAFVALVVRGRMATMGPVMEEAARDLYAEGWTLFRRVTLPLMLPGVVAGAMLAFTLSLDDFVISYMTYGPDSQTLPIYIHNAVRRGIHPQVHALSTLLVLATVLLVLACERLTRHRPTA